MATTTGTGTGTERTEVAGPTSPRPTPTPAPSSEGEAGTAVARVRHVCPLCEAGCGLLVEVTGDQPVAIRPNGADVQSHGFLCPKGLALLDLDRDPDRLTGPVRRRPDGTFTPIGWEEAFTLVAERLNDIRRRHGRDAIAAYTGTVGVHKYDTVLLRGGLQAALGTRNWTGASSQDTTARFAAAWLLYGSAMAIAVPDVDRTDHLLCLGANPVVSNGSLMTAPNMAARLRAIRERGGKVVVVDPRRTETAAVATEHVPIRPGTDAALLLAMVAELARTGRVDEERLAARAVGWPLIRGRLRAFTPERVSDVVGIPRATIERLAHEFADAPTSAAYSRMGVGNSRHATLGCWAVEVLNLVAGRLGEVGGSMFPTPAVDLFRFARLTGADGFDRYRSRVRGLPETVGELPATVLAEEIETPGPGQVRALLVHAGNPVLSVPNGRRLERALGDLEFMVAIDPYVNETTRHADVILPPAPLLAEDHVDLFFASFAVRNGVRWTPAAVPAGPDQRRDGEILQELAERLGGGITGMPPLDRLLRRLRIRLTPAALATAAIRIGPHGDRFLPWSRGLNGRRLRARPDGVDLGPLRPGFRHRVRHRGRRLRLAHPLVSEAMDRLEEDVAAGPPDGLVLIGRRQLRSNNSWMHNVDRLARARGGCELFVHPEDAGRYGVADGGRAVLATRVHEGEVDVRVTDDVRPGTVSLPHGYGHGGLAGVQSVAAAVGGVSFNDWLDDADVEAVAGQSVLNGVPVTLRPADGPGSAPRPAPAPASDPESAGGAEAPTGGAEAPTGGAGPEPAAR